MAKRGQKLQEFVAHDSAVNCLSIGRKSSRVFATGGDDWKVNLWQFGKPDSLLSLCGHTSPVESVTFDSAEGFVLGGASNGALKLWDLEEAKIVRTITAHASKCTALEFHPFGEFFASGSLDADLRIWDIRRKGCIHTYEGHTKGIRTISFTPDGRWVVSGGEDNVVKVWDLTAGKLLHDFKFHGGPIQSIDFHPHEFLLATGSADRTVKFWDLETFELIGSSGPQATGVRSMIFHPDGKTLFCGSNDNLKVFSWEPVVCHDDLDIGWSTLGDLIIHEGKLLGCSYHQSSVGVWVVDISLIGPYTGGFKPASNSSLEAAFGGLDSHIVKENESSMKSYSTSFDGSDEQAIDVKEIIHTGPVASNDICKRPLSKVEISKPSKTSSRVSTITRGHNGISRSSQIQSVEESIVSKSSNSNIASGRDRRTRQNYLGSTQRANSAIKGSLPTSSRSSDSGLSNLKKDSGTELHRKVGSQIPSRNVSLPVIVPKDVKESQNSVKCRNDVLTSEIDRDSVMLQKPSYAPRSSYAVSGAEGQFNAKEPANDVGKMESSNYVSGSSLVANTQAKDSDEGDQADDRPVEKIFERVVFLDRSFSSLKEKSVETPKPDSEAISLKYVKGVAIQHGRTKSLVESWERRDGVGNNTLENSFSSDATPQPDNSIPSQKMPISGVSMSIEDPGVQKAKNPVTGLAIEDDGLKKAQSSGTNISIEYHGLQKVHSSGTSLLTEDHGFKKVQSSGRNVTTENHSLQKTQSLGRNLTIEDPVVKKVQNSGRTVIIEDRVSLGAQSSGRNLTIEDHDFQKAQNPRRSITVEDRCFQKAQISGRNPTVKDNGFQKGHISRRSLAVDSFQEAQSSQRSLALEDDGFQKVQTSGRSLTIEDDGLPEVLLQNRDLFINVMKSRLTKLQMVRHCWEQNGLKGTISAIAKLLDQSVQIDVISVLVEKVDLFNIDLFSCLLPLLVSLLSSKTERYTETSLEMLVKLVKAFWPMVRSTMSASSPVGVDIEAEHRRDRCTQCFMLLEKVNKILPPLMRRGGSVAKHAMELNIALSQ